MLNDEIVSFEVETPFGRHPDARRECPQELRGHEPDHRVNDIRILGSGPLSVFNLNTSDTEEFSFAEV